MTQNTIAKVAVGLPIQTLFDYKIPPSMQIRIGQRVKILFGARKVIGYVTALCKESKFKSLKEISSCLDSGPVFDENLLNLAKWISDYYLCSIGEALEGMVPGSLRNKDMYFSKLQLAQQIKCEPSSGAIQLLGEVRDSIKSADAGKLFLLTQFKKENLNNICAGLIPDALSSAKGAILVLPEADSAEAAYKNLALNFSGCIAKLHSRLSAKEQYEHYGRISSGAARVLVCTRLGIFAPVDNLGLIILSDESNDLYRQETVPRYHTRQVCIERARLSGATLVFEGLTPSLEAYDLVKRGCAAEILSDTFPKRPVVNIVDMRREFFKGRLNILSHILMSQARACLDKKQRVKILFDRRGFSTSISCPKCAFAFRCKNCSKSLVYHFDSKKLICHLCNYEEPLPKLCPSCSESYLEFKGAGTQKLTNELHRLFPSSRIARLDKDSLGSYNKENSKDMEFDILAGTHLIADWDTKPAGLFAIILIDGVLNIPDFRQEEKIFRLLRRIIFSNPADNFRLLVQTFSAKYVSGITKTFDYKKFFDKECKSRKLLGLPPYEHVISLTIHSADEDKALNIAQDTIARIKKAKKRIRLFGPIKKAKLRGKFRYAIIIKAKDVILTNEKLRDVFGSFGKKSNFKLTVDVD